MAQTVEELAEILDNIKLEADRNAETFDKLLTSINNKLEVMSSDTENDDLIRVYLTELKKTLEERHALVVSEFGKIENSFNSLNEEQSNLTKTSEMKEMFDIFSNNMQSIAKELYNQKELIAQYDERFAKFSSDKTDKNEILSSISSIRKDVEVINQHFETSISDINANVQSIFKNLIVMDPSAQNDIVRRELENIYLSANAILSGLHTVEQKNDELVQLFENFITKEDYAQSQEKLNTIIEKYSNIDEKFNIIAQKTDLDGILYKTSEISDKINQLPMREDLKYFTDKTTELSEQISGLPQKEDLSQVTDKTVENLTEILDQISGKTTAISGQMNQLAQQNDITDIYKCIHEFSTILDTLKDKLTTSSEETNIMIREQLDKLNSVLSAVVTENDFAGFRHDLADFIQKIIDNSRGLNENLNVNKDVLQNLIIKIESLDIHKNIETVANALEGLRINTSDNTAEISNKLENISAKMDEISKNDVEVKINTLSENFYDVSEDLKKMQTDIFEKLSKENDEVKEKLNLANNDNRFEALNVSLQGVQGTALENSEKLSGLIENVSQKLDNLPVEKIHDKIAELKNNLEESGLDIKDIKSTLAENLSDDKSDKLNNLHNNIDFLRETIISAQNSNELNLTEKLLALRDMITEGISAGNEKFSDFEKQLGDFISNIQSINDDTEIKIGNSISEITDLKTEIEQIAKDFTEWNYNQENRDSKIVNLISSELGEIGFTITNLQDSIQAGVHQELTKNGELVENQINNLVKFIEDLKENLHSQNQTENNVDLETPLKEIKEKITTVKQEINLINTDITDVLNSKAEALIQTLAPLKSTIEQFSNIEETIETKLTDSVERQNAAIADATAEIKKTICEILDNYSSKLNVSDELISKVDDIQARIAEKLDNQISMDDIKNEILASSDNLKNVLSEKITSNNEDLKTLLSVAVNNDDITWAIDDLKSDISDKVTRIFNERNNYSEILEKTNEISFNNKKISDLLDALNQKIDILAISDTNDDDSSVQDEIQEIKEMILSQKELLMNSSNSEKINAIKNYLEELINKINTIENTELKDMRENIISAVLTVFEQISFIEESEDIKDFVEEKTDEINQNLIEVKEQLKQISSKDEDYSYTLQDVESDIAKLRLVINELSETSSKEEMSDISHNIHKIVTSVEDLQNSLTQEQISDLKTDFEKLSEDILSISSRTNKLILTSDESYNVLNNALNDFSNIVYKLEERINYFDNKEITERIEKKLDNVANIITGSANFDKVMRQALIYMGEWIDTTSENIESICEQSNTVKEIKYIIEKFQNKLFEQADLLNNLFDKFEEQEERIDRIEMKLEKILSAMDDIDNTKLNRKVDKLDKQLTKLSETIEKLATYVDE